MLDAAAYSFFRYQMHLALENALGLHAEAADEFASRFGRRYGVLETYLLDDADTVLVMAGAFASKGKAAVNRWRAQGHRGGLVRLRMVRPLPVRELIAALAGRRAVGVIDQNLSPGLGGILFHEFSGALVSAPNRPAVLRSIVGGLGGKDICSVEFDHVLASLDETAPGAAVEPDLLFTNAEWRQLEERLAVAGKPRDVAAP